jgi:hypothetical protein
MRAMSTTQSGDDGELIVIKVWMEASRNGSTAAVERGPTEKKCLDAHQGHVEVPRLPGLTIGSDSLFLPRAQPTPARTHQA